MADVDIQSLSVEISADSAGAELNLDKLAEAIANVEKKGNISGVTNSLNSLINEINKLNKSAGSDGLKKLSGSIDGISSEIKKFFSFKNLYEYIYKAADSFNEYYEAANFFGVSMKELTGEASDFIDKMNELLGIDPAEAMNNMSKIQSLTTSFGLASNQAYVLSKNLTQLGYDLSSLQNLSVSETFTKLQAAISGELEPIRRLGVDLSEARLQQELLDLGFQENISSLSQADKAVLRYIAIMKQTTDAQGDFARTVDSPANSIKVLQAQVEGLSRAVGSLLYPALKSILPVAIAVVEVIKEAVQSCAALMGVKVEFPDYSSVGDTSSALDSVTESAEEAKKALKNYSIGIDELNVIDPTSDNSSSSSSDGNILGDIDLSKYEYDMFAEYVGNSVDEIREKIKGILPVVEAIGVAIAGWKLVGFIEDLISAKGKVSELFDGVSTLKQLTLGLGVLAVSFTIEFTSIYDAILNGLNEMNLGGIIAGAIGSVGGGALVGKAIGKMIASAFVDSSIAQAITAGGGTISTGLIGAAVAGVVSGVAMFATGVYDALTQGLNELNALLIPAGSTMAGAAVGAIIGSTVGPIGTGIGAIVGLVVGLVTDLGIAIYQNWEDVKKKTTEIWDGIVSYFKEVPDKIGAVVDSIVEWFSGLPERIGYAVGDAVGTFILWAADMAEAARTEVPKVINAVVKFFKELPGKIWTEILKVIDTISDWRTKVIAFVIIEAPKIIDSFVEEFKKLPGRLADLGKDIWDGLVDGLNKAWDVVTGAVSGFTDGFINGFKDALGIHSPSKVFEEFGVYIDEGLANGLNAGVGIVQDAMNNVVNAVVINGQEMIDSATTTASNYVTNFANTLDAEWKQIDNSLKTDFFGSIETLWDAISNGDLETLGRWAAAYFYNAMDEEQKNQILKVAQDSLSQLNSALSGVWQKIAGMASTYIGQLVPSTLSATVAQEGLNVAMDSNPIGLVISLIGMLAGSLINFSKTNTTVANLFSKVWDGVYTVVSYVFEGLIRLLGAVTQGFVNAVNLMIKAYNLISGIFGGKELQALENPFYAWADKIAESRKDHLNQNKDSEISDSEILGDSYQAQYEQLKKQYDELKKDYSESLSGGIVSGGSSGNVDFDYSQYPGTSDYENNNNSYSSGYTSSSTVNVKFNEVEMRDAIYNGTYNAFLDIFQRYGDELTGGQELKIYLDGKQITASVEKRQNERGQSLMGNEVYAF